MAGLMDMFGFGAPMVPEDQVAPAISPAMADFGAAMAAQGVGPAQALGGGISGPYGGMRQSMMGGTMGGGGEGGGGEPLMGPGNMPPTPIGMGGIGSDAGRTGSPLAAPTTIPSPAGEPRPTIGGQGPMDITSPGAQPGAASAQRAGGANRIAETLKGVKAPPAPPPLRVGTPPPPRPSQNIRGGELMALLQALGRDASQIPLQLGRVLGGR